MEHTVLEFSSGNFPEKVLLNFHSKVQNRCSGKFVYHLHVLTSSRPLTVSLLSASKVLNKSESIKMVEIGGGCNYQCSNCAFLSSDTNGFINHQCDIYLSGKIDVYLSLVCNKS